MTRITCSCDTCKTNAAKIGATFPLAADVPAALAKKVKDPHGLVYDAHNPGPLGQIMRTRLGLVPVA